MYFCFFLFWGFCLGGPQIDFASRVPPRQPEAQILFKNAIFDDFENSSKNGRFLKVLDLGTKLKFLVMQFRIETTSRRSISRDFEFFENSSKN